MEIFLHTLIYIDIEGLKNSKLIILGIQPLQTVSSRAL